jgi:hypothetical protein
MTNDDMSGDHNQYQKDKSYLDDFECPRCGHCCRPEWAGLTDEELAEFSEAKLGPYDLCLEVEAKLKEKNT